MVHPKGFIEPTRGVLIQRGCLARPDAHDAGNVRVRMPPFHADSTTMLKRSVLLALVIGVTGCLPATERDFQMVQMVTDMTDAVNELRQLSYELQDLVDSLAFIVAKRDTVVRQLANLAGVPVPP
jgi:hypothetical protein